MLRTYLHAGQVGSDNKPARPYGTLGVEARLYHRLLRRMFGLFPTITGRGFCPNFWLFSRPLADQTNDTSVITPQPHQIVCHTLPR